MQTTASPTALITCQSGLQILLGSVDGSLVEIILAPGQKEPITIPLSQEQFDAMLRGAPRGGALADMPVEHEAKFLITKVPDTAGLKALDIRQSYLAIAEDGAELRIRDKAGSYTQTLKRRRNPVGRPSAETGNYEVEIKLTKEQYQALGLLPALGVIEKTRWLVPWADPKGELKIMLELDEYKGRFAGLWVLEAEAEPSAIQSFRLSRPDWVGEEVTQDERFRNRNILKNGLPSGIKLPK